MEGTSSSDSSSIERWLEYNFPILVDRIEPETHNNDLESTEESLKMLSLSFCLQSLVIPKVEEYMRKVIAPKFWSKFSVGQECEEKQGFENFTRSVSELYSDSSQLLPMLKKLEMAGPCKNDCCMYSQMNVLDYFKLIIRGTLLSQIPLNYTSVIEQFYKVAFNVFCNIEASKPSEESEVGGCTSIALCEGCEQEHSNCQCQAIVDVFHRTNKQLIELGLLERLVGSTLTWLIHLRIEDHVTRVCKEGFDSEQLSGLELWLESVVMNWLTRIYSGGSSKSTRLDYKVQSAVNSFKQKLSYFLYETYTRTRIGQLFNIVIEYPESRPAVDDLRICLERTNLRKHLIEKLQEALKTRLLHPGVSTPDILTAYVAAIKALRQLDPSGTLLEIITEPIKSYLRGREDTVRCVVSGLLDESSSSELAEELAKGVDEQQQQQQQQPFTRPPGTTKKPLDGTEEGEDEEEEEWEKWQPEPVDGEGEQAETSDDEGAAGKRRRQPVSDIISMLVNVYGSQDLFVNEYRTLLADRLLSQLNYQTEREARQLELLKRRFGEQQLHHCEVMIKDVCDSRRIDASIQVERTYASERAAFATSALVLSAQFWPPFKEDWRLELPARVQRQLERYVAAFERLKGSRTLCWKPHLGSVSLELQLRDRTLNLEVSPIHASIALLFEQRPEWSLEQLSEQMHLPATLLRRKIGFWQAQALLAEVAPDRFVLMEELQPSQPVRCPPAVAEVLDDDEAESAMASASDQREEELQVFWSYIVGMLTNLDSMPLERIHQMLKMFASQGSGAVECGLPELRAFLDKKVRQHLLLFSGGLYKLPKS